MESISKHIVELAGTVAVALTADWYAACSIIIPLLGRPALAPESVFLFFVSLFYDIIHLKLLVGKESLSSESCGFPFPEQFEESKPTRKSHYLRRVAAFHFREAFFSDC